MSYFLIENATFTSVLYDDLDDYKEYIENVMSGNGFYNVEANVDYYDGDDYVTFNIDCDNDDYEPGDYELVAQKMDEMFDNADVVLCGEVNVIAQD